MKKNAFTMVELIFVIVIIGILSTVAVPKFLNIKDKAKVNSELFSMSGLDSGVIISKIEFRLQDYSDDIVKWHNKENQEGSLADRLDNGWYKSINDEGSVLKAIAKKTKKLKIIGAVSAKDGELQARSTNGTNSTNDILFIIGPASHPANGVNPVTDVEDLLGKPDNNDVWVFNPNSFDINISSSSTNLIILTNQIIPAQSIKLVDINGSEKITDNIESTGFYKLYAKRIDSIESRRKVSAVEF